MVRAGEGGYLIDTFIELNLVAIGWNELGDLSDVNDLDHLKTLLQNTYPELRPGQVNNHAGQIFRFVNEFKKGDNVLTYNPSSRIYHIGEIESNYMFSKSNEYYHIRDVKWINKVNRDKLSTTAKNSLGSVLTIFKVSEIVINEFELIENNLNKSEELNLQDDDELESIKEDTEAKAFEFIKDKVLFLDWSEMEELVAGVLRGMGYKTLLSPKGGDRGKDIIASPDGLGLENPKIKVEVKHRKGSMGAPEIRNFLGGLRTNDRGLYISTGGFTKEAKYEADRSINPITLVNLDLLVGLIIQHYDNFDIDTRSLIPLKKIYWPI
ncbi:MAG: restriction endonuclease [Bacteroidia bacterium]|nr:restriction endonuclease [Bacteroidia bacterium]